MASTAGAHALAPQLDALGVEMASYKRERQQLMTKIEQLEQLQQPTGESREELKRLQHKEQSLLDLIVKLQEKDNLLLGSSVGAAAGVPLFENVILHVTGDANNPEEFVRTYARVSRATLQKVLDGLGCFFFIDVVQDPATKELVSFDAIELHDNMLLTALRYCVPWEARVSTLEGFVESSVKGFEVDATEALYSDLQRRHSSVKVLPIGAITNTNGKKREVDGAVIADGCAAILEAKQVLDDTAVPQLASCLDFIRDSELMGPAAELKGKKLLGFLAGRTLSNPGKVQKLVRDCRQHGYGIYVSSGRSMQLGNSRVPHLPVDCTMYKRSCGASSCLVRVA